MAEDASHRVFINNGNWRDSSSLDEALLPHLRAYLQQTVRPRELIVLQVLGQHFFYEQRCAADQRIFLGVDSDEVATGMLAMGRSRDIIAKRNDYDSAVHCGSRFLAGVLREVSALRSERPVSVLYFSDHGQEVGHNRNFAGHSVEDESGYTIPMLLWTNTHAPASHMDLAQPGFRLDRLHLITRQLLGIGADHVRDRASP